MQTKKKTITKVVDDDVNSLILKKIFFFKDVIKNTIFSVKNNNKLEILNSEDTTLCIENLNTLYKKVIEVKSVNIKTTQDIIDNLQPLNNELSSLLKTYGTYHLEDLLTICFGNNNTIDENNKDKYDVLKKYFHPISYKVINEEMKLCREKNLSCYDIKQYKQLHLKIYGVKLYVYYEKLQKGLLIYGFMDDIDIHFVDDLYVLNIKEKIFNNLPKNDIFDKNLFTDYLQTLNLSHYVIFDNEQQFYNKFVAYKKKITSIEKKSIMDCVNNFVSEDLYSKRNMLIQLLIDPLKCENVYLAYLLYDLLYNNNNTNESINIYNTFPLSTKQFFKNATKSTMQYINDLTNIDTNKIPFEQQICLMKTSESTKEKAMLKLKEVKSKTDDTNIKARQYLENLLKVPFGIYKSEPILNIMEEIRNLKNDILYEDDKNNQSKQDHQSKQETIVEIINYIKKMQVNEKKNKILSNIESVFTLEKKREQIIKNNLFIQETLKSYNIENNNKIYKNNATQFKKNIKILFDYLKTDINESDMLNIMEKIIKFQTNPNTTIEFQHYQKIISLNSKINDISKYMNNVKSTLDKIVYGHNKAKTHIEKIIAQWINGGNKSHIIGFEGPPGVGKTSLAKGLSECLKDEHGNSRPFSLIALGGDSNASTLVGHNYTYVGSTYGKIVQLLIDSKCMNPIILLDEVDKISRTESGKELIGVLIHMLDNTQNKLFEDKYFAGIQIDLSKVLFILSYNDVKSIDKVLLDRIYRIKFDSLTLDDKIVIFKNHLLPEICKNVGLEDIITFSDEALKYVIEEYTMESGVRNLKEKIFEIIGEINLNIFKNPHDHINIPIQITVDDIKTKYFKHNRGIKLQQIHHQNLVGVINCLWANSYGLGGILSVTAKFFYSSNYLSLKLTGLLDKMMEESFHLSLTNAYNLLNDNEREILNKTYNDKDKYGIHVHMGDGSIEKSGTSAGIAVTVLIYSLMTNKKIKHNFAITGEASDLNGTVGEIGALKTKIIYGIKSGVKNFIYPMENKKDFDDFIDIYKNNDIIQDINFYPISNVKEAIELIIE